MQILDIKEEPRESRENCEKRIHDLLEEKTGMGINDISIGRAHRVGQKSNDRELAIVAQFSFYKDKIDILRNCKKVKGTKISIFEDFSQETMQIPKGKWKKVVSNRKQGKILYLQYRNVIYKEGVSHGSSTLSKLYLL